MSDWEIVCDILLEMSNNGRDVMFGPHGGDARGFYACFYDEDEINFCGKCGNPGPDWGECGHGDNLLEAIEMARAISLGFSPEIPKRESFLE